MKYNFRKTRLARQQGMKDETHQVGVRAVPARTLTNECVIEVLLNPLSTPAS